MRDFGERFPSLIPWFFEEITRPPRTFLHGDLRLDQLFFAVGADDPPVTVLDWQMTTKGRGAYDVGYFLSQSLTTDTRRSCGDQLIERYAERLAERGIAYPREQLWRDYRVTTAWCFAYPVIGAGRIDVANDRQLQLLRTMLDRAATTIEDHDCLSLRPD
jgi:phosphotransferase family enzyme